MKLSVSLVFMVDTQVNLFFLTMRNFTILSPDILIIFLGIFCSFLQYWWQGLSFFSLRLVGDSCYVPVSKANAIFVFWFPSTCHSLMLSNIYLPDSVGDTPCANCFSSDWKETFRCISAASEMQTLGAEVIWFLGFHCSEFVHWNRRVWRWGSGLTDGSGNFDLGVQGSFSESSG